MGMLRRWSLKQISGWKLFGFGILITILDIIFSIVVTLVMINVFNIEPPDTVVMRIPMMAWYAIPLVLMIIAIEELIFRFIPLTLAVSFWGHSTKVLIIAILSSILFGLWHGSYHYVFIQGAGGFLYCIMFLKSGGFEKRFIRAGMVCLSLHTAFNAVVIILSFMTGNTTIPVRLPFNF